MKFCFKTHTHWNWCAWVEACHFMHTAGTRFELPTPQNQQYFGEMSLFWAHIDTCSVSNPNKSSVFISLWQTPLFLPLHTCDRILLQVPQYYRPWISFYNSWIWSLLMSDFTEVSQGVQQDDISPSLSLSMSLLIFFPLSPPNGYCGWHMGVKAVWCAS